MKKAPKRGQDPDLLDEYDFSTGVRGKYATRYADGNNVVVLSPDLAEIFPDSESVNRALRELVAIARKTAKPGAGNHAGQRGGRRGRPTRR
jgi:hypothetical protein